MVKIIVDCNPEIEKESKKHSVKAMTSVIKGERKLVLLAFGPDAEKQISHFTLQNKADGVVVVQHQEPSIGLAGGKKCQDQPVLQVWDDTVP